MHTWVYKLNHRQFSCNSLLTTLVQENIRYNLLYDQPWIWPWSISNERYIIFHVLASQLRSLFMYCLINCDVTASLQILLWRITRTYCVGVCKSSFWSSVMRLIMCKNMRCALLSQTSYGINRWSQFHTPSQTLFFYRLIAMRKNFKIKITFN